MFNPLFEKSLVGLWLFDQEMSLMAPFSGVALWLAAVNKHPNIVLRKVTNPSCVEWTGRQACIYFPYSCVISLEGIFEICFFFCRFLVGTQRKWVMEFKCSSWKISAITYLWYRDGLAASDTWYAQSFCRSLDGFNSSITQTSTELSSLSTKNVMFLKFIEFKSFRSSLSFLKDFYL